MIFFDNFIDLLFDSAPWLVLGLVLGGLIKTLFPISLLERHLSGNNLSSVTKATLLGAPLPLCSCGVVPAAVGLREAGASKPATVSFLISTPETGVDSVSVTYALLGPIMAVARLISALFSAFLTGLLVLFFDRHNHEHQHDTGSHDHDHCNGSSCCVDSEEKHSGCCGGHETKQIDDSFIAKIRHGLRYAFVDMLGDIIGWLLVGLVFAALVQTFVPSDFLTQWGSGLIAMIIMLFIGIPMYVCATASTPIAVGLIAAGISPGVALVFLLSGPATNIGTLGIISKMLGRKTMWLYLVGTVFGALIAGLLLDQILLSMGWQINASNVHEHQMVPMWLTYLSTAILAYATALVALRKLGR